MNHDYDGLLELLDGRRKQVEAFLKFLERETSWLATPASANHHLNVPGGLLTHSLMVTRTLLGIRDTLAPDYDDETCVIVGLFHDIGKVGTPSQPLYEVVKGGRGTGQTTPKYQANKDLVAMGVAVRSLYMCAKYLTLTEEEAQAICYHDGQYVPDNLAVKNKECPLTLLVHFADLWSSHVLEETEPLAPMLPLLERVK